MLQFWEHSHPLQRERAPARRYFKRLFIYLFIFVVVLNYSGKLKELALYEYHSV